MRKATTVIIILIFIAGISIMLYPTLSDAFNSMNHTKEINGYAEDIDKADKMLIEETLRSAEAYNLKLSLSKQSFTLTDQERSEYESLLSMSDTGVIGYINISKIDCYLPIYHGTDDEALRRGIGHLEGSSLPIGGESTHSVLSGHRGLPSAKLFSNLDRLEIGDRFTVSVLGIDLVYEVNDIFVVLPSETDDLLIVDGEDLCTLVTCTPYGINSHRLLVRGTRVEE